MRSRRQIVGTYEGSPLLVSCNPRQTVGVFDKTSRMNAFAIAVRDLPGVAERQVRFHVTGLLGQDGRG